MRKGEFHLNLIQDHGIMGSVVIFNPLAIEMISAILFKVNFG